MAKDLNPPNSDAVVSVPDEAVDAYKAAGFTEAKRTTRKADSDKK